MKYAKSYVDKFFDNIEDYNSKVELLNIAIGELDRYPKDNNEWITELCEIMNWQSMSDRSGVWTYYEGLNNSTAQVVTNYIRNKGMNELTEKYIMGIGRYTDESVMGNIDSWIHKNESKIYDYIVIILMNNKAWFYNLL